MNRTTANKLKGGESVTIRFRKFGAAATGTIADPEILVVKDKATWRRNSPAVYGIRVELEGVPQEGHRGRPTADDPDPGWRQTWGSFDLYNEEPSSYSGRNFEYWGYRSDDSQGPGPGDLVIAELRHVHTDESARKLAEEATERANRYQEEQRRLLEARRANRSESAQRVAGLVAIRNPDRVVWLDENRLAVRSRLTNPEDLAYGYERAIREGLRVSLVFEVDNEGNLAHYD